MQGARTYCGVFKKAEQFGKLYIMPGSHARGKTFHIYVIPSGSKAELQYPRNPPINIECVEVYGITGGNPGWSESYGWLHAGAWQEDFLALWLKLSLAQHEKRVKEIETSKDKRLTKEEVEASYLKEY